MHSVKSAIITAVLAFSVGSFASPATTPGLPVVTVGLGGDHNVDHDAALDQSLMPSRSLTVSKPLEKDLEDGAPSPQVGEQFYCHTTQTSANLTDANSAVAFFAALNKQACQNKPDKCLNMLSLPGGNKADIRVWTCGPTADSTDCANIAPILTQIISNCSKDFTSVDSDGNKTTVTRAGGVAWLSPAKNAWLSLEGKSRE